MINPVGIFLLLAGLPAALWPYRLARLGEQVDAIGSTTPLAGVEPADWNVLLTRVIGVGMILVGCLGILGSLAAG
ncbi:hypothetical protein [Haladaptatus sp. DJG-WS-42]|uniref:hypothetical protein n=1 Tax=Haladaptatus sp. DJG-WS-42 TaxID=3120516 RepID=UPI0030D29F88